MDVLVEDEEAYPESGLVVMCEQDEDKAGAVRGARSVQQLGNRPSHQRAY